jgi:signal transduction histidine kinase
MQALAEASANLASELDPDIVLQRLADLSRGLIGARYAAMSVLGPSGEIQQFITSGVSDTQRRRIGHIPAGTGLLGVLLREGSSLRLDDMANDSRAGGFPASHPKMKSLLGMPVFSSGRVVGNLYLTDREDGQPFSERDEELLRLLSIQAAAAIRNAELYDSARRRTEEWKALFELGRQVSASPDLQQLLDSTVARARALLNADVAVLMMLRSSDKLVTAASEGTRSAGDSKGRPLSDLALQEMVLQDQRPVIVTNASSDKRLKGKRAHFIEEEGLLSAVCVPLIGKQGALGTLTVGNRVPTVFEDREAELLEAFANWTAVAIETSRLYDRLEGVARLEERERIAMDLHDGVIQSIYAVGLHLEDCQDRLQTAPEEVAAVLEKTMEALHQVIKDIRSYIFDLRPKVSRVEDLPDAIRQLVEDLRVNTLMTAEVESLEQIAGLVNEPQALAFFHIAQEALNNVSKHSQATLVGVKLTGNTKYVTLEVRDNGVGFDGETASGEKHGLRNMRDRARSVGAALVCESAPGRGTLIRAELPVTRKEVANG